MKLTKYLPSKAGFIGFCSIAVMAGVLAACSPQGQNKEYKKPLDNEFGQAATQAGANACASLFSVLGQTTTLNSKFAARVIPSKQNSNENSITGIIGQTYGSGDDVTKGTGTIYAAPKNGVCEGIMVRSLLMKKSCVDVAKTQLPEKTERREDLTQTAVFTTAEGGFVTMIPVDDSSCVVTMTINLKDQK